ncbi:MAG: hypothetical protein CMP67_09570 [Flavobacteriales bacterium]|nr:hypothetical protein [Flavobacteriales bacterium]|tara:strand:- start:68 stop:478 length:411 start_codon:yes stop_codon:yes gene_type:complete
MMKKLFILLFIFTLYSCEKNEGTIIWRVWYAVQLPPDYDLKVTYNSDKYFDSGVRDTVYIHDSSYVQYVDGFWIGQHLQDHKDAGYYINVQIDSLTPYDGYLGVYVYANDTSLLDSVLYPYGTNEVILQGEIPQNF